MSAYRSWQRDIQDADHLAARAQQLAKVTQPIGPTVCYACRAIATKWIRSTAMHFSAPRCDGCGDRLVAMFKARGITDVRVDAIRQTVGA
jgi:hypothetical protein